MQGLPAGRERSLLIEDRLAIGVAGAIGCYLGGCLAASGEDLVFVGRPRLKEELSASGLSVTSLEGISRSVAKGAVRIETDASALADRDVILVCVKSAQTAGVAGELAGVLRAGTVVVSMQNGVRNADTLREHLRDQLVLGGIVGFNVVSKGEGVFRRATGGPVVIEASADPRVRDLEARMRAAGIEVELADDIRALQWSKLVMNLNNAVSALSDRPTRDLLFTKGYRLILAALMREAIFVLRASGKRLARLGPMPVTFFPRALALPTPIVRMIASVQMKIDPEARSSMWADLTARRATEVEYLNGEIVRLAEEHGVKAPLNRRVVDLVQDAERASAGSPGLSAEELWRRLQTSSPPPA